MKAPDIAIIECWKCPVCKTRPQKHCFQIPGEGIRIWPWHPGSAGPDWCHKERRDLAVSAGRVER